MNKRWINLQELEEPRNCLGVMPIEDRQILIFGGWKGHNWLDVDLIKFDEAYKRCESRKLKRITFPDYFPYGSSAMLDETE